MKKKLAKNLDVFEKIDKVLSQKETFRFIMIPELIETFEKLSLYDYHKIISRKDDLNWIPGEFKLHYVLVGEKTFQRGETRFFSISDLWRHKKRNEIFWKGKFQSFFKMVRFQPIDYISRITGICPRTLQHRCKLLSVFYPRHIYKYGGWWVYYKLIDVLENWDNYFIKVRDRKEQTLESM